MVVLARWTYHLPSQTTNGKGLQGLQPYKSSEILEWYSLHQHKLAARLCTTVNRSSKHIGFHVCHAFRIFNEIQQGSTYHWKFTQLQRLLVLRCSPSSLVQGNYLHGYQVYYVPSTACLSIQVQCSGRQCALTKSEIFYTLNWYP